LSEIRATTISDAAGTGPITLTGQVSAKIWAAVETVTTTTLHDSFNISSITDTATGSTTYSYTNAMSDQYYSLTGSCTNSNNFLGIQHATETAGLPAASTCGVTSRNHDGSTEDVSRQYIIAVGDLA